MIETSYMGPSFTTFSAVYYCPLKALEALHLVQSALGRARLKCDLIGKSHIVELLEAKEVSRDRLHSDRIIIVSHLSSSSTYRSVQEFFSYYGTLDGTPSVYQKGGKIESIVRFQSTEICYAALMALWSQVGPLKLDGAKIEVLPYTQTMTSITDGQDLSKLIQNLSRASVDYEKIAKWLIGKEIIDDHSLKKIIHLCLFSASLCHLCNENVQNRTESLSRIRSLDFSFEGTPECNFIAALAASLLEGDLPRFNNVVNEFNLVAPMFAWKISVLSEAWHIQKFSNDLQELQASERKT